MSSIRLFEPRMFDPMLSDSLESMFKRFMTPMRMDFESGALDMRRVDALGALRSQMPMSAPNCN